MVRHGAYYLSYFIDTWYEFRYLIFHKLEVFGCFRRVLNLVENQNIKCWKFSEQIAVGSICLIHLKSYVKIRGH